MKIETSRFDAIAGQSDPLTGFGQILPNSVELEEQFQKEAAGAKHRIKERFRAVLAGPVKSRASWTKS